MTATHFILSYSWEVVRILVSPLRMSQKGRQPFRCLLKQGTGLRVTDLIVRGLQWGMTGLSAIRSQMYPMYLQTEKAITEGSVPDDQFSFCTWRLPWNPVKVRFFHSSRTGVSMYSSILAAGTKSTLPFLFNYKNKSSRGRKFAFSSELKIISPHLLERRCWAMVFLVYQEKFAFYFTCT